MEKIIELTELLKKVHPGEGPFNWRMRRPSEHWVKLFSFYTVSTGRRLGMGCGHCYQEVYEFAVRYIQENSVKDA